MNIKDVTRSIAETFTDYGDDAFEEINLILDEENPTPEEMVELGVELKRQVEADTGWEMDDVRALKDIFKERGAVFPKIEI